MQKTTFKCKGEKEETRDLSRHESTSPPIPHFPAPHKYYPPIHRNSLSSISLQEELMMSSGLLNKGDESGYVSLTGSRKDSSSSSNSSMTSLSRRKESSGIFARKDSLISRKDSSLSTWSSPEYDLIYSEINGGESSPTWCGSNSILLSKYIIPEEKGREESSGSSSNHQETLSEGYCSSGFFESLPLRETSLKSGTPRFLCSIKSDKNEPFHQNYKDIFKEMFAILRKVQY